MINLNDLWAELAAESSSEKRGGTLKRSIYRELGLSVGYDTHDDKKLLLLDIESPETISNAHFPKCEGTIIEKKKVGPKNYAIAL